MATEQELKDKIVNLEKNLEKEKGERSKAEAKVVEFEKAKTENEKKTREQQFKDYCEDLVKKGRMLPAVRDKLFKKIPEFKWTEEGYLVPFVSFKDIIENSKAVLDTGEHGSTGDNKDGDDKTYESASDELFDRAKKYQLEKDVSFEKAQDFVLKSDPDLAKRYKMNE